MSIRYSFEFMKFVSYCFSQKKVCLKKSTVTFFSQRDFQKSTGTFFRKYRQFVNVFCWCRYEFFFSSSKQNLLFISEKSTGTFSKNYQYFFKNYRYFFKNYRYFFKNYRYFFKNYRYFLKSTGTF